MMERRSEGKVLGGVCTGITSQVNLDANVVRLLFIVFSMMTTGVVLIAYLGLWLLLPLDTTGKTGLQEILGTSSSGGKNSNNNQNLTSPQDTPPPTNPVNYNAPPPPPLPPHQADSQK